MQLVSLFLIEWHHFLADFVKLYHLNYITPTVIIFSLKCCNFMSRININDVFRLRGCGSTDKVTLHLDTCTHTVTTRITSTLLLKAAAPNLNILMNSICFNSVLIYLINNIVLLVAISLATNKINLLLISYQNFIF